MLVIAGGGFPFQSRSRFGVSTRAREPFCSALTLGPWQQPGMAGAVEPLSWQGIGQFRPVSLLLVADREASVDRIVGFRKATLVSEGSRGIPDGTVIDAGFAQWPRAFRAQGRVRRWPAPVALTGIGAKARRGCPLLPGSRIAPGPALACRGRPASHSKSRDPCARFARFSSSYPKKWARSD
jgi:hypothetical protein